MNPWCLVCGARLLFDLVREHTTCPNCEDSRALIEMINDPETPELRHGTMCHNCSQDHHIYCDECDGMCCFEDTDSCIVCGMAVLDGWNLNGWEVHPHCHGGDTP